MTILLTAGTGKTSQAIARLLQAHRIPFLLTSRRGQSAAPEGMYLAQFDWLDPSTYDNPFTDPSLEGKKITAIYLIAPEVEDPTSCMNAFIDKAIERYDVNRFVLMAGSNVEPGANEDVGRVWKHIVDKGCEWTMLRCTWFMENYLGPQYQHTIKGEGKIYSACGDGKIPFISVQDIAAVAFKALTDEKAHNCDYRLLGPELLTLDDVAAKFTKALDKPIEHVKVSQQEMGKMYRDMGLPEHIADLLAMLEDLSSKGIEDRINETVEQVTGRKATAFGEVIGENIGVWQ